MDRWNYDSPLQKDNESTILTEHNVRLYDGDEKTRFEGGQLILTTHRLIWSYPGAIAMGQSCLTLALNLVVYIEEEASQSFLFSRSKKVVLFLSEPTVDQGTYKAQISSVYNFVKLSFREGCSNDFFNAINNAIETKFWESQSSKPLKVNPQSTIKTRTGIVGIERSLQEKQNTADKSISLAFQDLNKLMSMAKEMVQLSNTISTKIKERHGHVTDDETVQFKSYLLSLGIDDPVTRDTHKSSDVYFKKLSTQICNLLVDSVEEVGGMMVLTDVFCRVNRARGLELLSPEDCLNACTLMDSLGLPLKLYEFNSGVKVLQLRTLDDENVTNATASLVSDKESFTSEELAQFLGISVTLAQERLFNAERLGKLCRDNSIEGLRFYPNRFLTMDE